jgi:glycosyltransferase involved in cell wall biosynthesis
MEFGRNLRRSGKKTRAGAHHATSATFCFAGGGTRNKNHPFREGTLRVVWIYKSPWKKSGPIVYMGVLNALACARREVETDLFLPDEGESDTERDLRDFYGVEPDSRLRIHRVQSGAGSRFSVERPVYSAARELLDALLASGEKVLVVTRELGILPPLLRLRRRHSKLRVIHEAHDFYGRIGHLPVRRIRDYRRWLAERFYIPRTDGLVCITQPQRKLYAEVFPRLASVFLPLGCVEPKSGPEPETRRRARCLGYVGHLTQKKGYGLLLEAAQHLRAHAVTIQCYGGYADPVKRLNGEIAARGLSETIHIEPFRGPSEMMAWLASQVSIGVAPLEETFYNRNLTCPVKVLDTLSQGLPVVGSDLPSVRDLAGAAGEYHRPGDVAGFVSAALGLLDDSARYLARAEESLVRARTLAWSNRAASLLEFAGALPARK